MTARLHRFAQTKSASQRAYNSINHNFVAHGLQSRHACRKTDEYRDWIDGLKDVVGRARILVRVDRLMHGNPGDHRNLTDGVSELKIDVGPGYRVYYSKRENRLLLLLAGGDKSSQAKDIEKAIQLNRNYGD